MSRSMVAEIDIVVVGAGIVGLATARALHERDPAREILVVDKEPEPARHQSGHNSGVIHSGIYYRPDSDKTALLRTGRAQLLEFVETHGIDHEICGKIVVAVDEAELPRLHDLEARAEANQIPTRRLDADAVRRREPHIAALAALEVPSAGIVDFEAVCRALVAELRDRGMDLQLGTEVSGIETFSDRVEIDTTRGRIRSGSLVNCSGLYSDRVAGLADARTGGVRIMPFRGEYFELAEQARGLVRDLVYPVPDPAFPFLGVHLTRMIDGSVHAGPNAVPAMHREGYRWRDVSPRDTGELLLSARTWRLAHRYWRTGLGEIRRSLSRRAFLTALRRLCPELDADDLVPTGAGVRAQAIDRRGVLLDDFAFAETGRTIHVVNAPSPAATASLAIGARIARRHDELIADRP
jgi:L-2-hydroxyglutarate oxidase